MSYLDGPITMPSYEALALQRLKVAVRREVGASVTRDHWSLR